MDETTSYALDVYTTAKGEIMEMIHNAPLSNDQLSLLEEIINKTDDFVDWMAGKNERGLVLAIAVYMTALANNVEKNLFLEHGRMLELIRNVRELHLLDNLGDMSH